MSKKARMSKRVADYFWKHPVRVHRGFSGFAISNFLASGSVLIRMGGQAKSNILTIHNSNSWWIRYDRPHRNVPFYHININPEVSGLPDPHILISGLGVAVAEILGPILVCFQYIAPLFMAIKITMDVGFIGHSIFLDLKNRSTRNTIKTVSGIFTSTIGGVGGYYLGWCLGTLIMPGIGTLLGPLIFGALGGVGLGRGGDLVCDRILDRYQWGIYRLTCQNCGQEFVNRRYEEGSQTKCCVCRLC